MAAPVVSWYNELNDTQETSWDLGVVDAGSTSPDKKFLIWNNRGGTANVSDMTNCTITTKDTSGGDTGDLVTGTWIEVLCDSKGDTAFTPVGGTTTHPIGANGTQTISGATNDGSTANSVNNFAEITVHANVPLLATAGTVDFVLRVSYQYV